MTQAYVPTAMLARVLKTLKICLKEIFLSNHHFHSFMLHFWKNLETYANVCKYIFYLTELVVSSQILSVFAAGFGTQKCYIAMVFCCRDIAISGLQLVVKGGGCKVQRFSADVLVAGGNKVHCHIDTGLQIRQREKSLQKLERSQRSNQKRDLDGDH